MRDARAIVAIDIGTRVNELRAVNSTKAGITDAAVGAITVHTCTVATETGRLFTLIDILASQTCVACRTDAQERSHRVSARHSIHTHTGRGQTLVHIFLTRPACVAREAQTCEVIQLVYTLSSVATGITQAIIYVSLAHGAGSSICTET